jgi:CubicO group peptidase (beta-lactamase class C family)
VTPSTLFYGGSTTKAFTAAAMSFLVDENKLQWNTPISNLIRDDFVLENDYATTHTTIEDALSHRTGLPRHDFSYGGTYDGHKGMPKDVVRSLRHLPLTAEPRTRFQYCNIMFVVASYVIETLTGMWLGDVLKERIWRPLGMKSTVCFLFLGIFFCSHPIQMAFLTLSPIDISFLTS